MSPRLRSMCAGCAAIVAMTIASPARAADPEPPPFSDADKLKDVGIPPARPPIASTDYVAFPYWKPPEKHYLRAALEITTVYGVGLVDYLLNTSARGGHLLPGDKAWDLRYDWPTFRSKLTGENYHLDTNRFNTNYISHPFAGTLYYWSARGNHLSVAESSGYAIVGGLIWEYFGEFREEVSINDIIVTPVAGIAIGETTMQIGGFFKRGRKSFANDLLATFFSPIRAANDWADAAEPRRSTDLDDLGFPRDEWHRFDLFAGGASTWQRSETASRAVHAYAGETFGLDMRVVNLPGYGSDARRSDLFDDGNAAHFHFDATLTESHLADAVFAASFMPAGYYWRSATLDAAGRPFGDGLLVGPRVAFEYGVHDYFLDRATTRGLDVITILSPVGFIAEYTHDAGRLRLSARFEVGGELAGVESAALADYRRLHDYDDTNLHTVLQQQGYDHMLGVTVAPSLSLAYGGFEIGSRVRLDSFQGIDGYDEQQARITQEVPLADRRMNLGAWATWVIPGTRLVLGATGRHLLRTGDVGDVHTARSDSSLAATLGVRF